MQNVATGAAQALHGIVDRQAGGDVAAGRVDVHQDVLVGILGFEEQQLGDHNVGELVVDRGAQEHDAVLEQPGEEVPAAFATGVCSMTVGTSAVWISRKYLVIAPPASPARPPAPRARSARTRPACAPAARPAR